MIFLKKIYNFNVFHNYKLCKSKVVKNYKIQLVSSSHIFNVHFTLLDFHTFSFSCFYLLFNLLNYYNIRYKNLFK